MSKSKCWCRSAYLLSVWTIQHKAEDAALWGVRGRPVSSSTCYSLCPRRLTCPRHQLAGIAFRCICQVAVTLIPAPFLLSPILPTPPLWWSLSFPGTFLTILAPVYSRTLHCQPRLLLITKAPCQVCALGPRCGDPCFCTFMCQAMFCSEIRQKDFLLFWTSLFHKCLEMAHKMDQWKVNLRSVPRNTSN